MKLALFLDPYGERHPSGLGRAVAAWTEALVKNDPEDEFVCYVRQGAGHPPLSPRARFVELSPLAWRFGFGIARDCDTYLFFTPIMPLFFSSPRTIVIAHDFGYLDLPATTFAERLNRRALKWRHARALGRAALVIAVSQATKSEIVKHFALDPGKIRVIYNGVTDIGAGSPVAVSGAPERFFLYAGVVKERKNVLRIVEAFAQYRAQGGTASLVVAGKAAGAYADAVRALAEPLGESVRFLGFVSDAELAWLFHRALAFIYPSLVEGFGMTVVEAMAAGLPVVTSGEGALAEVAGDAALLVDPRDAKALAAAMARLDREPELRAHYAAAGLARSKMFSWDRAARDLRVLIGQLESSVS